MIKSNASTDAQKKLVEEYLGTLGEDAEFVDGNITFAKGKGQKLTLNIDGEEPVGFTSYTQFRAHFSGEEAEEKAADAGPAKFEDWLEATRAQMGSMGGDPEAIDESEVKPLWKGGKTPKDAAEEVSRKLEAIRIKREEDAKAQAAREAAIKEASGQLEAQVESLATDIRRERSGELQKNEARYQKGEHLVALEDLGRKLKEAGDTRFKSQRQVMDFARERVRSAMEHAGVIDTTLEKRLSDQEVSATRTVYRTYMHGGMDTSFRLVDTINPETGQPYQDDTGNPPEMPVKGIALNKLYILAKMHNPEDHDAIVSFAHRTGEKALTAARKLMDPEKDNAVDVITEIQGFLDTDPVNAQGEPYNSTDEAILDFVANRLGKAAPTSVKTIKVDAGWFEGQWSEIKAVATALFKHVQFTLDDKGEAPNTQILERMANAAFADFEDSEEGIVRGIVNLFELGEDITDEQASEFVEAYFNPPQEGEGEGEGEGETAEKEAVQA